MARRKRRKPVTPEENEAAYQLCLERERIRERDWRETRQGAFESAFLKFDFEAEEARERTRSASWLSDHGKGARLIYCELDPKPKKPTREQLIDRARKAVSRHMPDCLQTFWLVIRNGNNRKESIWQIMKSMAKERPNGGPQKPATLDS